MQEQSERIQNLLTLPPRMAAQFERLEGRARPEWYATCDPEDRKLGSGGGTVNLLLSAWQTTGPGQSFEAWLHSSRKLIMHGGGQSRRLPAYAAPGKVLMPVPVFRWARGQRLDQSLLDLQSPEYQRVLNHGAPGTAVLITSGDVLLRFHRDLPAFPQVDVLGLGMHCTPEQARDFGVFFSPRLQPSQLAFFLQKPTAARIRELLADHIALVDTGMWLLSERAVAVLLRKCGWDPARQALPASGCGLYELYSDFGLSLGVNPAKHDPEIASLTSAVVALPGAEFYHFGTSRQLIESVSSLQNLELDETKLGLMGARRHPDQYLQNAHFEYPLRREQNHTLWIENSAIPKTWELAHDHVLTGVPANQWDLKLEPGVCLDFVPVGETAFCVRFYGINDAFRGPVGDAGTKWLDRPAPNWFWGRGISLEQAGIASPTDIQDAPLFPVLEPGELTPRLIEWLYASQAGDRPEFAAQWRAARRLSANYIAREVNLVRVYEQRQQFRSHCLLPMLRNHRWSVFFKLDLESTARLFARTTLEVPPQETGDFNGLEPLQQVHDQMFRSAVARHRRQPGWEAFEQNAFARLREMIVRDAQLAPVEPRPCVKEDQIVWARSPVRLDLAGGWTDTPPYCLEYGGKVVNVAVDLNGQPPIQVFAKLSSQPQLVVRSIDLGVEQRLATYEELDTFDQPGSEFALAKAALALAGFLPRFHAHGQYRTLREQLEAFGGGVEISMLSAIPKGSGLGTSSILAATLLATLGDLCGLNWDRNVLFIRTLALEQMLTTGGGWQDQAGAIFRGLKLIETGPGLAQRPTLRWLPGHLLEREYANKTILLYYTGITRMAKNILHEIVRGIFLNSPEHLHTVQEIGANAEFAFNTLQQCDYEGLCLAIRNSWRLNQKLDAGTNPPEVQAILAPVQDWLAGCKLLGAGGGGYLLMLAKDEAAATRIQRQLTAQPPNPRARFVQFQLSEHGLQITRS
jgi:galactokinase/mevalonate kinase-like predicted kinase